jgi:antitoxin VapB
MDSGSALRLSGTTKSQEILGDSAILGSDPPLTPNLHSDTIHLHTEFPMAIHIREVETDKVVRKLAQTLGVSLTEAIRISAENELKRVGASVDARRQRISRLQERVKAFGTTGLKADKAFFDELSGDL